MQRSGEGLEIIGGMLAGDSPQTEGARLLALLEDDDRERLQAYLEARARRTADALEAELAATADLATQ